MNLSATRLTAIVTAYTRLDERLVHAYLDVMGGRLGGAPVLHNRSRPVPRSNNCRRPAEGFVGRRRPSTRTCAWCRGPIDSGARADAKFCSKRCRQSSWRFRVGRCEFEATGRPMRFAYADPPYPGKAHLYPERREVDHAELIARLVRDYPDGWALSTSSEALRDVLPLCPSGVRVGSWHRLARRVRSRRALTSWEPLLVVGGRPLPVDVVQDLEDALIARGRFRAFPGAMVGMKPPPFAEWMFRQLGACRGDTLDDLFPGSGAVTEAWRRFMAEDRSRLTTVQGDVSRGDRQAA